MCMCLHVCIHHILFTISFSSGHWVYFHVLTILNNANVLLLKEAREERYFFRKWVPCLETPIIYYNLNPYNGFKLLIGSLNYRDRWMYKHYWGWVCPTKPWMWKKNFSSCFMCMLFILFFVLLLHAFPPMEFIIFCLFYLGSFTLFHLQASIYSLFSQLGFWIILVALNLNIMSWIIYPSKFICWSSGLQYLRM